MAEKLFPGEDPVGQDMRIGGTRLTVIGVFVKFGDDMMGMSMDESVLIPLAMARNFVNLHWSGTEMVVKGPDGGDVQELKADVGSIMRRLRRFGPRTEDNFAVNEMSILSNQLDNMFRRINFAGGGRIIGIFSILVGASAWRTSCSCRSGSARRRSGSRRRWGRPYFVLFQFVFEAVIFSVAGGAIGLLLIFFGVLIVNSFSDFTIVLTLGNIILGLVISLVVGAVAGFFPAWSAARMEPVKAIYHN